MKGGAEEGNMRDGGCYLKDEEGRGFGSFIIDLLFN
jgi:hypothetical protein